MLLVGRTSMEPTWVPFVMSLALSPLIIPEASSLTSETEWVRVRSGRKPLIEVGANRLTRSACKERCDLGQYIPGLDLTITMACSRYDDATIFHLSQGRDWERKVVMVSHRQWGHSLFEVGDSLALFAR